MARACRSNNPAKHAGAATDRAISSASSPTPPLVPGGGAATGWLAASGDTSLIATLSPGRHKLGAHLLLPDIRSLLRTRRPHQPQRSDRPTMDRRATALGPAPARINPPRSPARHLPPG